MERDTRIANAISKFIDRPHAIGDPSKGWDCLNSLLDFYRECGVSLPDEFEGYTEVNYPGRWAKNPKKCRQVLERFVLSLGNPVQPEYLQRGDLLIFKTPQFPSFPAIYTGNGHVFAVFKEGAKQEPLNELVRLARLTGVRRLIE
jgi:cell wall-associated NlpC family hydrolase